MSQRQPGAQPSATAASAASKAAPSSKVFNPYAKKKSTASASVAPASNPTPHVAANIRAKTVPASSIASNPYNRPKRAREQTQDPPQRRLSPLPVNESTTFSQAFGGADPDAHFGDEERAQQVAFDESLSTIGTSSGTESNNNSTHGISPRDHHTMLQPHVLHISTRQRGNPILAHIRNVPFKFSTMVPDYILAPTRCALFLSLRYHNLHPNYVHRRIAELKSDFEYRLLLCHVDIEDNTSPLLFLNDICVQNNFTLILAWSEEEAARYLETVRAFDGKDASLIQKREYKDHIDMVAHALKSARNVNTTDSSQLLTQFGCWKNLVGASADELSVCPGVGPKKVRRLFEAFHRPFSTEMVKRRKERVKEKQDKEAKEGKEKKASSNTGEAVGDKKVATTAKK
mmetsp:Transcript_10437/g.23184  ORF Transcript_10437/g.23184 Transcript_10437/m.23184 type:complete len:401 (-) Transcript_10437:1037-2239(-)